MPPMIKRPKKDLQDDGWNWDQKFVMEDVKKAMNWDEDDWVMGVDEAGRGPVVGDMVYGAMACRIGDHQMLVDHGFDDSKALTPEKRESIFKTITTENSSAKSIIYEVRSISAEEISNQQLSRTSISINKISHNAGMELITKVKKRLEADGKKLKAAFIDVVGPQDFHQRKFQAFFPEVLIIVRKKADSTFPVTSGASICAKQTRDSGVEEIAKLSTGPCGCGYPGDPETKKWMRRNSHQIFVLPQTARFDWKPVKEIAKSYCAPVTWDGNGEDLPELFSTSKIKRWQYFQEMFLVQPSRF
eukprot:TRINITY_DN18587_c0_g1_i1.p1 TRINITY_DN18587_c0_g1~~TRINITY_DN18587_c0_g1_i1.p1  ORF type:complete len:323 (+),score=68.98 TRINITY_DN18587_c0_g1_i1:68-970(+)